MTAERELREKLRANGYDPIPMIGKEPPISGRRPEMLEAFSAIWAQIDKAKCSPHEVVDLALGTIEYTLANVTSPARSYLLDTLQDWLDCHKKDKPENPRAVL